jgi:YrbI family 3-deoxy-D-manno-octulosonate 8-phosphate phosphatase
MVIKFVCFDFDGVFTDGKFYFNNNNTFVSKCYNAKDTYALKLLKKNGIKCGIITNDKIISIEYAPHIFNRLDKVSLGSDKFKLEILDTWLDAYEFSYEEVAYIGDDLADIPVLKKIGFSACPNDAVDDVKEVSQYICKNKGGAGAVREFVDLIIKKNISEIERNNINLNINNDGKITAVIPVRKGSTRCKNKNIRKFGDTNLLKLKIETLKKVKGIDRILVSSNCDKMLGIAKDMGVDIHKRDELYATSNCTGADLNVYLAKAVETEFFMRISIMTPFIPNKYEECINLFKDIVTSNKYDSLNTFNISQHFTWNDTKPMNYQYDKEIPSFQLPKWYIPNFGINIIETKNVIKYKNIIGKKPYFYKTDLIQGIDIDYPCDFLISEMLYNHNIVNEEVADLIIKKRDNDKIELLDCTIRDGGYLHNWEYSFEQVKDCYKSVSDSGYHYFEIGFKADESIIKNKGKWYYSKEEDVKRVKESCNNQCKIAVLIKPGDININNIPHSYDSSIDLYRVLINRSTEKMDKDYSFYTKENIEESCKVAQDLITKGYEVTINIGCFDIITDTEIKLICNNINNINGLKAIYLADTYGSGTIKNIPIQLHKFYLEFNKYDSNIPFGFHCHNNNEDALSKTSTAIYHGCTMIDSCIGGLGRGAGNLKSEQLMSYLYKDNTKYINKISPLIVYFDKHILSKKEYQQNYHINSHPYYMISSKFSLHPNYIFEILSMDTDVITDINLIIKLNKYTKENNNRNYNKKLIKNLTDFNYRLNN